MSQAATARQISNAPEHSTAYYFIEGLNELGIEHLFCNFGTDHAPTIEALADRHKRGEKVPNVMLCPHENTAAHMAMGYAAVTGRGQAVLVQEALRRAHTIMETKPAGPVYFMAQRETLTQQWASDQIRSYAGDEFVQPQSGGADPAAIAKLADKLIAAEHPILVCGYAGQ